MILLLFCASLEVNMLRRQVDLNNEDITRIEAILGINYLAVICLL